MGISKEQKKSHNTSGMMTDIINDKFREWTKGLESIQSRISIFNHIRDIPFGLIPDLIDPMKGPMGILQYNKGSCSPKHFLLKIMFGKLKIPTKYATYPFKWGELPAEYPEGLKQLADKMPVEYHLACKAYINERWILVDATWDLPLKKADFVITENWDGISDTLNAVNPLSEIVHKSIQERIELVGMQKMPFTEEENTLRENFYTAFNVWLEVTRISQ